MPAPKQAPNWQPISFLPALAEMIDGMLDSARDIHDNLQRARTRPYVMDDYTIGRVREAHGAQLEDLWLYEEQLSRWRQPPPGEAQRREIARLTAQLTDLRRVLTATLALADDMKDATIEKMMGRDDVTLGIEFLMGKHRP